MNTALRDCWRRPGDAAEAMINGGGAPMAALLASASAGFGLYGVGVHLGEGVAPVLSHGVGGALAPLGLWALTAPTLFVLGSQLGSRLRLRQVMRVSAIGWSFAGLALAAAVPVDWFLDMAMPREWFAGLLGRESGAAARLYLTGMVPLAAVLAAGDVADRALRGVDCGRPVRALWLLLLGLAPLQLTAWLTL